MACGDWRETRYFRVDAASLEAYSAPLGLDALDTALDLVFAEYGNPRLRELARREQADVYLEPDRFGAGGQDNLAGLFTPPRTIRATWFDGDCLPSGGFMHELIHFALDLDRKALDHAHARDELWHGALDRAENAAWELRLGCPDGS